MAENPIKTLTVDNFHGTMTMYTDGDINSGLSNLTNSFGADPFNRPGNLTWMENPVQIDAAGAVVTGLIVAGKQRVESGIVYVYAIDHLARLYKIQVNDPTTYNPNYDNPVLLSTLAINSPTFTRGGFIDFYGATEKIYIGHDKGLTSIDFNGSNEAFVGLLGSWTQTVPRPLRQFLGKLYIGNGANIAEVDTTATVTSYAKLSPGFPTSTQVRDLDTTPDGTYLQAIVTTQALGDITAITPNTTILSPSDSWVFKWNGTDAGYTALVSYPAVALSGGIIFGAYEYVMGYDWAGASLFNPVNKLLGNTVFSVLSESPLPNAMLAMPNLVSFMTPLPFGGFSTMANIYYGSVSEFDVQSGYWCLFDMGAGGTETDIMRVPCQLQVSNYAQGGSTSGYTGNIFGVSKIYFSTLETSALPTTKYKLYRWAPSPTGLGEAISGGTYQTQTQLFTKKVKLSEVRIYGDPWVAGNAFTIELIGSGGNVIAGTSKTFTAGSNLTVGDDFAWYAPASPPTYAIGVRVIQEGSTNFVISKIEIDYAAGGK